MVESTLQNIVELFFTDKVFGPHSLVSLIPPSLFTSARGGCFFFFFLSFCRWCCAVLSSPSLLLLVSAPLASQLDRRRPLMGDAGWPNGEISR